MGMERVQGVIGEATLGRMRLLGPVAALFGALGVAIVGAIVTHGGRPPDREVLVVFHLLFESPLVVGDSIAGILSRSLRAAQRRLRRRTVGVDRC